MKISKVIIFLVAIIVIIAAVLFLFYPTYIKSFFS